MALLIKNGNTLVPVNTTNIAQQLSKLPQVVDGTATVLTENDLQGATSIRSYAFNYYSGLTSITIPNSVTSIGNSAFNYCSGLTSITIPNSVTSIGENAFFSCSGLTGALTIPNSVISIMYSAFRYCGALTSITIGSGITNIDYFAFGFCTNVTSVVYAGQAPKISSSTFFNCSRIALYDFRNCTTIPTLANTDSLGHATGCQIVVPDALYDNWILATNWSALTNVVWVKASDYVE